MMKAKDNSTTITIPIVAKVPTIVLNNQFIRINTHEDLYNFLKN